MTALVLSGLTVHYHERAILRGLNHRFAGGRWHLILGKSGAGKSTLLHAIAGLIDYRGSIADESGQTLTGRVSLMAQEDDLLPWLSARDNTTLGARLRGEKPDLARAEALLAAVGLADFCDRQPRQLSGGQRQRVALARTLYENRPVILMDEPFSALDAVTRYQLQNLAARVLADKTVIMITHDPAEALRLAHHLYILEGSPAQLREQPLSPTPPPRENENPAPLLRALAQEAVL